MCRPLCATSATSSLKVFCCIWLVNSTARVRVVCAALQQPTAALIGHVAQVKEARRA